MSPLLKRTSEPLALGYVGFRVAELGAVVLYLAISLLVVALGDRLRDGAVDARFRAAPGRCPVSGKDTAPNAYHCECL